MTPSRATDAMTDGELLEHIRAKEAWATDALLGRYLRMMKRLAFRLIGPADLDDVLQESLYQALRALPRLRHADALPTWFASVVVNVVRKRARRRRLLARLGFVDGADVDMAQVVSSDAPPDVLVDLQAVYRAVKVLPEKIRTALILRRVEHRPLDEIAQIMGASLASVKRWIAAGEGQVRVTIDKGSRGEQS